MVDIQRIYEIFILINIYTCTLIAVIGSLSNLISLLVFWHSNRKTPKIRAKDYLSILSLVNLVFIVTYWYTIIGTLIVEFYDLDHNNVLNWPNQSKAVCKIVNYLILVSRCLNSLLTLAFTMRRFAAIFFPLQLRKHRYTASMVSGLTLISFIVFSVLISTVNLYYYEVIVTSSLVGGNSTLCDVAATYKGTYSNITNMINLVTVIIPLIIMVISNIAILIRLRSRKRNNIRIGSSNKNKGTIMIPNRNVSLDESMVVSNTMRPIDSEILGLNASLSNMNLTSTTSETTLSKYADCVKKSSGSVETLSSQNERAITTDLYSNSTSRVSVWLKELDEKSMPLSQQQLNNYLAKSRDSEDTVNNSKKVRIVMFNAAARDSLPDSVVAPPPSMTTVKLERNLSFPSASIASHHLMRMSSNRTTAGADETDSMVTLRARSNSERDLVLNMNCANTKKHYNHKMLILLTTFYILINIPHFANSFIQHETLYRTDEFTSIRYVYHLIWSLVDIFLLGYFTLSGLLLFAPGKIYRRHLYGLTQRVAQPFKHFRRSFSLTLK